VLDVSADADPGDAVDEPLFARHGMSPSERLRASHSYGLVLALIAASFIFQAAAPDTTWTGVVTVLLQGATLLLALRTSEVPRHVFRIALLAVSVGIVATLVGLSGGHAVSAGIAGLVSGLLVAAAPIAIARGVVRQVRAERTVTVQTVFGALCIYLLIGLCFAFLYGAAGAIGSGPFYASGIDGTRNNNLYFSFVTMSTTGYGDLTAAGNLGRTMAIIEAIFGQLYLVTVVAVVVSHLGRRPAVAD
jgi:hypothetical protein